MTRIPFVAILTSLILSVVGCDSTTSLDSLEPGTFTLRIDDGEEILQASASHWTGTTDGIVYSGFTLGLQPYEVPDAGDISLLSIASEGLLEEGEYAISDSFSDPLDGVSAQYLGRPEGVTTTGFYYSRGGTLTISHLEVGGVVEGSFSITAELPSGVEGTFEPDGNPILLEGAFSANYTEV